MHEKIEFETNWIETNVPNHDLFRFPLLCSSGILFAKNITLEVTDINLTLKMERKSLGEQKCFSMSCKVSSRSNKVVS